jgi:hypothetical protein
LSCAAPHRLARVGQQAAGMGQAGQHDEIGPGHAERQVAAVDGGVTP